MKNKRLKFAIAAIIACIALLIGATLAYFTDRALSTATGTAGTVKIKIDDAQFSLINPNGTIDNFNPGDGRLIKAPVENLGNKSVDIRQSFKITMIPANLTVFTALPNDPTNPMGWAIYTLSNCTLDAGTGNYVVNSGATPIAIPTVTTNSGGSITLSYLVPTDVVLNGVGTNAETESGVTIAKTSNTFVVAMMPGSDNSYQGATVKLDVLAEAKQHRNTASVSWASLQQASTTISSGTGINVVPAANQTFNGTPVQ